MPLNTETLGSLCELVVDCPHSTPKWTDEGIIVLRNQNIRNGVLDLSTPSYTNEEDYQKRIKRAVPQVGDIVFTREAPMGEVCMIPKGLNCCLGQRQVLLRPSNDICGEYLFWALQSPYVQHQISWNEGTGTTVSNVRIPVLKALMIPRYPDSEKQSAHVLSALAQKIELNKQTNQTLEQMAQTLFKSWFVDFDPVFDNLLAKIDFDLSKLPTDFPEFLQKRTEKRLHALNTTETGRATLAKLQKSSALADNTNANKDAASAIDNNIHQHFPDEFEYNDKLGWIPKGWSISSVGEEFDVTMGQSPPGSTYNEESEGLPFFQGKTDYGFRFPTNRIYCTAPKRLAQENDTLVSVRAPVGDINLASENCAIGRGLAAVRHKAGSVSFTYYAMNDLAKYFAVFEGEGTVFGSINQKDFKALPQLVSKSELVSLFNKFCTDWDQRIQLTSMQINQLTKLRDTLLPKLISGELSLSNVAEKR